MKLLKLAIAAAIAVTGLTAAAAPAAAQNRWEHRREIRHDRRELRQDRRELRRDMRRGNGWRYNRGRHYGWRYNRGPRYGWGRHRVCNWVWRYGHRQRVCYWRRWR